MGTTINVGEKQKNINSQIAELSTELNKFKTQYDALMALLQQNNGLLTDNNELLSNFNNDSSDDSSEINWDEINENLDTLINYNESLQTSLNRYIFNPEEVYQVYENNEVSEYSIKGILNMGYEVTSNSALTTTLDRLNDNTREWETIDNVQDNEANDLVYTVLSNDNDTIIILNLNPGSETEYDVYTVGENCVFTKTNRTVSNIAIKEENDSNNTENPSTPVTPRI